MFVFPARLISKWRWLTAGLGLALAVHFVVLRAPSNSVEEIHNAGGISNFALVEPRPHEDDWPWWRGTDGRNVATRNEVFEYFSSANSDSWQTTVPGRGQTSPIAWGDRLFLLTNEQNGQQSTLRCIQRSTGREEWWTTLHQRRFSADPEPNWLDGSTPACDGQYVFSVLPVQGQLIVSAVDLSGRIVWQTATGTYESKRGYRSSPVIFQSLIIVAADQSTGSYLAAIHRQTGQIIWRVRRPNGDSAGSPVVAHLAGRPQLVLAGQKSIASYDPATGDSLWTYRWSAGQLSNSVAFDDTHVFATCNDSQAEIVCIRSDGQGDVTKTHQVWSVPKIGSNGLSPVYHAGKLYVLSDEGLLRCLDSSTGTIEWRLRLSGTFTASPMIAGDRLICGNEAGQSFVVGLAASGEILAEKSLPEGTIAAPIIAGDSIFIRTSTHLYRFKSSTTDPIVEKPESGKRRL